MTARPTGEDDARLREILLRNRTVAVYGMSASPAKPAHYVPAYLREHGYEVLPVNPRHTRILGHPCYARLADLPRPAGILDVFRPSAEVGAVVAEAIERRRRHGDLAVVWLQLGIRDEEARRQAEAAGIAFVQDRCMLAEHRRLGLGAPVGG